MKRRILVILSTACLVLSVLFAVLWVRSYWLVDRLEFSHYGSVDSGYRSNEIVIWSSDGVLMIDSKQDNCSFPPKYQDMVAEWRRQHPRRWIYTWTRIDATQLRLGQPSPPSWLNRRGFWRWQTTSQARNSYLSSTYGASVLALPHWCLLGIGMMPALMWGLRRWKQWKRRRQLGLGLCLACGYDLRATPGRCPECGTSVPKGMALNAVK